MSITKILEKSIHFYEFITIKNLGSVGATGCQCSQYSVELLSLHLSLRLMTRLPMILFIYWSIISHKSWQYKIPNKFLAHHIFVIFYLFYKFWAYNKWNEPAPPVSHSSKRKISWTSKHIGKIRNILAISPELKPSCQFTAFRAQWGKELVHKKFLRKLSPTGKVFLTIHLSIRFSNLPSPMSLFYFHPRDPIENAIKWYGVN